MSLITSVLVRGINNLSDARYCAGMGADYLTFNLDPALPNHLAPEAVKELGGWVAGIKLVGEFSTLPAAEINAIARDCGLSYVLLTRIRPKEELAGLELPVLQLMNWIPDMLPEDVDMRFKQLKGHVAGFVLPTIPPQPLTGVQLAHLTEQARTYSIWLAAGFATGKLRDLLNTVQPAGIVLEGGDEIKPGLRDFSEMEAVFEELED
ncbi:hypothetical protein PK28_10070 [Hymenobacter sp. DG25B]|uniref:hypothetical protein n=1 Tax=Hymenobacter sp. DG25B TaxID=1385664 RepID=UPI0005406F3B|nr:hypothetical protein [Hymenobacter sp. DG25B]AIZ63945.1 hypothetical protein PK28_10070 [Hymenobacter sp. DG25B]